MWLRDPFDAGSGTLFVCGLPAGEAVQPCQTGAGEGIREGTLEGCVTSWFFRHQDQSIGVHRLPVALVTLPPRKNFGAATSIIAFALLLAVAHALAVHAPRVGGEVASARETFDGPCFQYDHGGKRLANTGHRGRESVVREWRDLVLTTLFHDGDLCGERRDDRDVRADRERYVAWKTQRVDRPDMASLRYIGSQVYLDHHHVYILAYDHFDHDYSKDLSVLEGAKPENFRVLKKFWMTPIGCDDQHVWIGNQMIADVHPDAIRFMDSDYWVDGQRVYHAQRQVSDADPQDFEVFPGTFYARQRNTIYYKTEPIPDADAASFVAYQYHYADDRYRSYDSGKPVLTPPDAESS